MKNIIITLIILCCSLRPTSARSADRNSAENPAKAHSTLLVTFKRETLEGKALTEISTYVAQYENGEFEGAASLNIGGTKTPHYLLISFDASPRHGIIAFEVSDSSVMIQGMIEGTTYEKPLKILDVERPLRLSNCYTISATEKVKLKMYIQLIEESSK